MPTSPRPQRRLPWPLVLAGAAALGARLFVPSVEDRVRCVPLDSAPRLATGSRPLLYDFTADWCGPCKRLERDLFADPRRSSWLSERFVPVRVVDREREDGHNPDAVQRLQDRFGVQVFPTLVVAAPDGTVLARQEGYGGNLRQVHQALSRALNGTATR